MKPTYCHAISVVFFGLVFTPTAVWARSRSQQSTEIRFAGRTAEKPFRLKRGPPSYSPL
jgi:hypothetical protein